MRSTLTSKPLISLLFQLQLGLSGNLGTGPRVKIPCLANFQNFFQIHTKYLFVWRRILTTRGDGDSSSPRLRPRSPSPGRTYSPEQKWHVCVCKIWAKFNAIFLKLCKLNIFGARIDRIKAWLCSSAMPQPKYGELSQHINPLFCDHCGSKTNIPLKQFCGIVNRNEDHLIISVTGNTAHPIGNFLVLLELATPDKLRRFSSYGCVGKHFGIPCSAPELADYFLVCWN